MSGIIPKWADDKAGRVLTMFSRGDTAKIDRALLHGAFAAALVEERERCAAACEAQATLFLSTEYAANQPIGSLTERFACDECAAAIRAGAE